MPLFSRRRREKASSPPSKTSASEKSLEAYGTCSPIRLRLSTSFCYIVALVFIILVEIGNINDKPVICSTYFLKVDLTNIIPKSVPNAVLINSIARSIGLHDFYQVGLWSFCEGYNDQGITYCSPPKTRYWFNPIEILLNELLAGATVALPARINDALALVKKASQWMFVFYLIGAGLTFISIFLTPLGVSKQPRWKHRAKRIFCRQLPVTLLSLLAFLFTGVASTVATVMFVIMRNVFESGAADLNIGGELGANMLAFTWIATSFTLVPLVMQLGTCCGVCCFSGKRKAQSKSMQNGRSVDRHGHEHGQASEK